MGPFSYVNPSKQNWISGYFGVGGFSITCVANLDRSETQIYLGKANKNANKAAYDYLYARKDEIEQKLGVQLGWNRLDENKASLITYTLPGISIAQENDWVMMAKFHAEWAKKFNDVFVPLLQAWANQ